MTRFEILPSATRIIPDAVLVKKMARHDAKSLALFWAIAQKLQSNDSLPYLQAARDWAARFSRERPEDIWLAEWVVWLDTSLAQPKALDSMLTFMTSTTQHAIDMRSSSPFSGVLTTKERTAALLAFERTWREET
ncbi:hypothetical protein [Acidithiobacillus sp.]|uniref:hypothetical protein n=1 Tax=Acidithiobacillus sp. TaxID=1872118 RepID=UPI003D050D1E